MKKIQKSKLLIPCLLWSQAEPCVPILLRRSVPCCNCGSIRIVYRAPHFGLLPCTRIYYPALEFTTQGGVTVYEFKSKRKLRELNWFTTGYIQVIIYQLLSFSGVLRTACRRMGGVFNNTGWRAAG